MSDADFTLPLFRSAAADVAISAGGPTATAVGGADMTKGRRTRPSVVTTDGHEHDVFAAEPTVDPHLLTRIRFLLALVFSVLIPILAGALLGHQYFLFERDMAAGDKVVLVNGGTYQDLVIPSIMLICIGLAVRGMSKGNPHLQPPALPADTWWWRLLSAITVSSLVVGVTLTMAAMIVGPGLAAIAARQAGYVACPDYERPGLHTGATRHYTAWGPGSCPMGEALEDPVGAASHVNPGDATSWPISLNAAP